MASTEDSLAALGTLCREMLGQLHTVPSIARTPAKSATKKSWRYTLTVAPLASSLRVTGAVC
eukprot:6204112-Pleurochrysis_carterae.AAC.2